MPETLTVRQRYVLDYLKRAIATVGYPPSVREMCRDLKIRSLRGVTIHLDALARKGYLIRGRGARSIRLLADAAGRAVASVPEALHAARASVRAIPILGRVAAGQPLLATEHLEGTLAVDEQLAGHGELFALRVRGDSMINAGILSGDYVVVRQQPSAEDGEIVVALLEDEATVKRLARRRDRVLLKPEHPRMQPITVGRDEPLQILGKVVGLYRKV